ncbi:unnamed protein product [Peniophora sp. CBMAI 1063]|nr:unnamed protein product [Peniophora sp. CBMAI 1063]
MSDLCPRPGRRRSWAHTAFLGCTIPLSSALAGTPSTSVSCDELGFINSETCARIVRDTDVFELPIAHDVKDFILTGRVLCAFQNSSRDVNSARAASRACSATCS